jgi:hypothetical protein
MRVYINRQVHSGPWGGGNLFVKAYHDFAADSNLSLVSANPDVILLAGLDGEDDRISAKQAISWRSRVRPDSRLVLRVNENDARKGTIHVDAALIDVSKHIDGTVFVSEWLRDYFTERGWACGNNVVIHNGVDADIFKPQAKANDGKINIVAHHWSDNRLKGADIYERLDRLVGQNPHRFTFTYIGRHRCDFKSTVTIQPLHGPALGAELGKHDVYVSASRFDPGPNHITESISCGLPTYVHVEGGGCVEFAGLDHTYDSWEQLERILVAGEFKPNSTRFDTWETCVERYNNFLSSVTKAV